MTFTAHQIDIYSAPDLHIQRTRFLVVGASFEEEPGRHAGKAENARRMGGRRRVFEVCRRGVLRGCTHGWCGTTETGGLASEVASEGAGASEKALAQSVRVHESERENA